MKVVSNSPLSRESLREVQSVLLKAVKGPRELGPFSCSRTI